jgi:hypothetical protein
MPGPGYIPPPVGVVREEVIVGPGFRETVVAGPGFREEVIVQQTPGLLPQIKYIICNMWLSKT